MASNQKSAGPSPAGGTRKLLLIAYFHELKKIILPIILFCLLSTIFIPVFIKAQSPIVPQTCGMSTDANGNPIHPIYDTNGNCTSGIACPCGIGDFFTLLGNIYNFIVLWVVTPLAIIALIVGGIFMMVSAGNPTLMGRGKQILWTAIIGLVLVFCSWLIINFILCEVLHYCTWNTL